MENLENPLILQEKLFPALLWKNIAGINRNPHSKILPDLSTPAVVWILFKLWKTSGKLWKAGAGCGGAYLLALILVIMALMVPAKLESVPMRFSTLPTEL